MWHALLMLGAQAVAPDVAADPVLVRMVDLYRSVCLVSFPDDSGAAAAMQARGAEPLGAEQVRIYLHDDPGRGWRIADGAGEFIVTIEAHPYHACGVRRHTSGGFSSYVPYRSVADAFERPLTGFQAIAPQEFEVRGSVSRATGEQRVTEGGGAEALFAFENAPAGEQRGATTDVEVRFVHQIVSPGAR